MVFLIAMKGPILVFDGGCPFCRHFAELSELRSGINSLQIRDGRSDKLLRNKLAAKGFNLSYGAILIDGENILHGADAINWICSRMRPSANLLKILAPLMANQKRSRLLYPLLLQARRLALKIKGIPLDPG